MKRAEDYTANAGHVVSATLMTAFRRGDIF